MGDTTPITVTDDARVTLINVFTVEPARHEALLAALDRATREVFASVPGFLSANLHSSLDGTRIVNYAQWSSARLYREALRRPEVREHLGESAGLAESFDPTLTRVRSLRRPAGEPDGP